MVENGFKVHLIKEEDQNQSEKNNKIGTSLKKENKNQIFLPKDLRQEVRTILSLCKNIFVAGQR